MHICPDLGDFFNSHHDKLLCTSDRYGQPNIALMGTPRLSSEETIDFDISGAVSRSLENIKENKNIVFFVYETGNRARDYKGARIYAEVTRVETSGEIFEKVKGELMNRFGVQKAEELQATIRCKVKHVRPVIDTNQKWNESPRCD